MKKIREVTIYTYDIINGAVGSIEQLNDVTEEEVRKRLTDLQGSWLEEGESSKIFTNKNSTKGIKNLVCMSPCDFCHIAAFQIPKFIFKTKDGREWDAYRF